jgi:hypothetical protein
MFQTKQQFDTLKLINDLLANNELLVKSNQELALAQLLLQQENTRLVEKNKELAEHIRRLTDIPTQFASGPLWMSEEEEDARFARDTGDINGEMLREKLLELGLDPNITNE